VAIDAISLLEGGLDRLCDRTIALTAPLELRVRRIMARDNISEQYARLRISARSPTSTIGRRCDLELNNAATAPRPSSRRQAIFRAVIESIKEEKAHGKE
jgi:L-threonylcarbamoyladenylate synthase